MLSIEEIKKATATVCSKYDVERAYLFGSYSRGEADEESDVDLRIDTGKDNPKLKSMLQVCGFEFDLEELLNKKVQVITLLPKPDDKLNSIFRENVLRDEVLIYASQ